MRVASFWLLGTAILGLTACGGKVIVDGFDEGAGGAGGTGGAGGAGPTTSSSSSSSNSSSVSSTSSGVTCPATLGILALCGQEGQVCPAPLACCNGSAVCKGGRWQYLGQACGQPCTKDCGPDNFACQLDSVCVAYIGKTTTYECRPKPCPGALACGCAAPICAEQSMVCSNIQDGFKILCDCKGPC